MFKLSMAYVGVTKSLETKVKCKPYLHFKS